MSDYSRGPGWWQASDGKWYPPEQHADHPAVSVRPLGKPRSIGWTIVLAIVTFGIWTWVWSYWNGDDLQKHNGTGAGGVVYLLLTIFIAPVTMFLMANEVEKMYRNAGEHPPITTIWGLWFLLPLIGNIIWYVRIQKSLNDFWMARGAQPATGPV